MLTSMQARARHVVGLVPKLVLRCRGAEVLRCSQLQRDFFGQHEVPDLVQLHRDFIRALIRL